MRGICVALLGAGLALGGQMVSAGMACADELRPSGKLLLTQGVSNVEGAGGGGIASWALISGYETRDGIGGNVHATYINLPDYEFRAYGASVGFYDCLELSYTRQAFDTGKTGAKLGLGSGFTFHQDVLGAKLRVLGDAVYNQDSWVPQVAVGAQYKKADRGAVIALLGGRRDSGVDWYVAASKVLLDQSLVLNGTIRATKANQTGLLGFGGSCEDGPLVAPQHIEPGIDVAGVAQLTGEVAAGAQERAAEFGN